MALNNNASVIDSSGFFGLGTNAPVKRLHVNGAIGFDNVGGGGTTPGTPGSVKHWFQISLNGTNVWIPSYQ